MDKPTDDRYLATTVLRCVDILNLLGAHNMTASQIAEALDLNKSTVHRMLYTLEYCGYIERVSDSRTYCIGLKLVELCSLRINDIEVLTEAKPYLRSLVETIRQPVHLAIYNAGAAVYIDKIDIMSSMRIYSAIGKTIPVHCSAVGKALLLNKTDSEILAILQRYGMQEFTPYTITSPEKLLAQLHDAKIKGYTVDNGEHEENVFCLAVPIYDYRNDIIASISTAANRATNINRSALIDLLKSTSYDISRRLGYSGHKNLQERL